MKKCPYCPAEIQDAAIVCPYCGRDLIKTAPLDQEATRRTQQKADYKSRIILIVVAGFIIALSVVLLILIWNSY